MGKTKKKEKLNKRGVVKLVKKDCFLGEVVQSMFKIFI